MRWMNQLRTRLVATLGNEGAIKNVQSDIDRRTALVAHLESLAVRLALVDQLRTTEAA